MNKLLVVLGTATIMSVGGVVMWNAEATPLSGATNSLAVSKSYSAVQKTGCMFGTHRCPAGTKWSCVKYPGPMAPGKKCVCRPC